MKAAPQRMKKRPVKDTALQKYFLVAIGNALSGGA
jgi:hypothetical protein